MKYRWDLAPAQPLLAESLARQTGVPALLAQCLINRDLAAPESAVRFLDPRLRQLADPFLLPHMDRAIDRLWKARERDESLVVFGDYDVDGVTATAVLLETLAALGWKVSGWLPSRFEEGYGLSRDAVERCLADNPVPLLLAVDCGSTAADAIDWLRHRKVDVIVLDHHQVGDPVPQAAALVNPQLASDREPDFRELCSVGLAFKLAHALVKRGRAEDVPDAATFDVRSLLDLVALGTIADLVPLVRENRILVAAGLNRLETTTRPGLIALKDVAGTASPPGVYEVGFQLAPRLNAAGRLDSAFGALDLIRAGSLDAAMPIAHALDACNRERQALEQAILKEALQIVQERFKPDHDLVIVEGAAAWHVGVVGIVAARVLQEYYRPTLILGGEGAEWRGSGRSIPGFDLAAALSACGDLLIRHGGHAMAAGVTLAAESVDALRERLNGVARRVLNPADLQPPLRLDAEVGLEEMTLPALRELNRLQPFGQGNPGLHFVARGLRHERALRRMGRQQQHVKMWVTDGAATCEAVWWRAGDRSLPVGQFDLAFSPQVNQYNGRRTVQLKVLDWRPG